MRILCKDCWITHDTTTLLASCKRCDANTRIPRLDPLPDRAAPAVPAAGRPAEFVCRIHPTEPLDLYCPECEAKLSARAEVGDRSVVAIMGDVGVGKTWLLRVLSRRLRPSNGSPVSFRRALGDTDEQIAAAIAETRTGARVTPATDAVVRNYAWEVMIDGSPRSWVAAVHDAAGEVWNRLESLDRSAYDKLYRYLDLVGSVIFLVDGERIAEALDASPDAPSAASDAAVSREIAMIDALGRRTRAHSGNTALAIVISKADVLWNRDDCAPMHPDSGADRDAIDVATRALLGKAGRAALLAACAESFTPVRCFAISAFGTAAGSPSIDDVRPVRIEEPLIALLRE